MREYLTSDEVELIMCYADYDMKIKPTAEAMHYDRKTVWRKFTAIFKKTGFNPSEFWDLYMIVKELMEENANGNEVPPD